MTGLEMIIKEREEQLEKHGYTPLTDQYYKSDELLWLAQWLISVNIGEEEDLEEVLFFEDDSPFPNSLREKLKLKPYNERLAIAGAFIAAHIDKDKLWEQSLPKPSTIVVRDDK